jgi:hypothetical protein
MRLMFEVGGQAPGHGWDGAGVGGGRDLDATLAGPAALALDAEPPFRTDKRYSPRSKVFSGQFLKAVSGRPPRSAQLTLGVTSVTVLSVRPGRRTEEETIDRPPRSGDPKDPDRRQGQAVTEAKFGGRAKS